MTETKTPVKELEHIWRARCSSCGDTQIVTTKYKAQAEWILVNMLCWRRTVEGCWYCRNCQNGQSPDGAHGLLNP